MSPDNKSRRRAIPANYVHKTANDFMRWLRALDAHKKQGAGDQIIKSDRATSKALMVWDDDGGAQLRSLEPSGKALNRIKSTKEK